MLNKKESYIIHTKKGTKKLNDHIRNNLLKGQDDNTVKLFVHILNSHEINIKDGGWSPIPISTIRKSVGDKALKNLRELEVIEWTGYSDVGKKCREYRVKPQLFRELFWLTPGRVKDYTANDHELFNLMTGKKLRKKKRPHEIYNKDGKLLKDVSEIVEQGIVPIQTCVFDYVNVETRLNYLRYEMLLGTLSKKEELSYMNDERCYRNILLNDFDLYKENILGYTPRYKAQSTGRKSEIGGGFQSCSREQKEEAWRFRPDIFTNYDLKSSQVWGLYQQLEESRLETLVLDKYIHTPKKDLADEIGIDVDCWKGLLYGTFFGGFPKLTKYGKVPNRKLHWFLKYEIVRKHICDYLNIHVWYDFKKKKRVCNATTHQGNKIISILQRFYDQNKELVHTLDNWRDYLADKVLTLDSHNANNKITFTNKSGMVFELQDFITEKGKLSSEGKRKLASHILQGQESCFISHITSYSKEEDCPYLVFSDQHDGLLVMGKITPEYVDRAKADSGFKYADLVEKPIIDNENPFLREIPNAKLKVHTVNLEKGQERLNKVKVQKLLLKLVRETKVGSLTQNL